MEYPDARLHKVNEEHGYVDFSDCDTIPPLVGDAVHIIPVHTCVVTNLHNQIYGVRGDRDRASLGCGRARHGLVSDGSASEFWR